jgi:hypothetical protein
MDDDEWFQQVHDGHEKIWAEDQALYKDVCTALIEVGPVKRLELGAGACKVKPTTPAASSASLRRSSARDSSCSGASTARRGVSPFHQTPPMPSSGRRASTRSSVGSCSSTGTSLCDRSFGSRGRCEYPSSAKVKVAVVKKSPSVRKAPSPFSTTAAVANSSTLSAKVNVASQKQKPSLKTKAASGAAQASHTTTSSAAVLGSARAKQPNVADAASSQPPITTSQSKADLQVRSSPSQSQSLTCVRVAVSRTGQALLRAHNRRVRRAQLGLA